MKTERNGILEKAFRKIKKKFFSFDFVLFVFSLFLFLASVFSTFFALGLLSVGSFPEMVNLYICVGLSVVAYFSGIFVVASGSLFGILSEFYDRCKISAEADEKK